MDFFQNCEFKEWNYMVLKKTAPSIFSVDFTLVWKIIMSKIFRVTVSKTTTYTILNSTQNFK